MPTETIECQHDKSTKNKERFNVSSALISGSIYTPKNVKSVKIEITWEM